MKVNAFAQQIFIELSSRCWAKISKIQSNVEEFAL